MATRTTQVHERHCDRCDRRVQKDRPRVTVDADGVKEVAETQTGPSIIDLCRECLKSAITWWTGPERREAKS